MSSKIIIIFHNIIHQMLKIRKKIIKNSNSILAEHQSSFSKIDIFFNFS